MKSVMETPILLSISSSGMSWWRKVWCFLSLGWLRPNALPLFPPLPPPFEPGVEREAAKELTEEIIWGFCLEGGALAVLSPQWLDCCSNPLLTTCNALGLGHRPLKLSHCIFGGRWRVSWQCMAWCAVFIEYAKHGKEPYWHWNHLDCIYCSARSTTKTAC